MTTIVLNLDGAFPSEQALREMVATHKVCFDHGPFYVMDGQDYMIQIGFQLNIYAAFKNPRHLPLGEDAKHHELVGGPHEIVPRVFPIAQPVEALQLPGTAGSPRALFSGARRASRGLPPSADL